MRLIARLKEQVLNGLDSALRRFLHRTALPQQFDPELAQALLADQPGADERAVALLTEAQRLRLFLMRSEDHRWWRYHPLFRAALLQHNPESATRWLEMAIAWFEQQGEWELAMELAFAYGLGERAVSTLERLPTDWLWPWGRVWTLWQWVQRVEAHAHQRAPRALLTLGQELHRAGHWQEGRSLVQRVASAIDLASPEPLARQALNALANMAHIEGKYEESLHWAERVAASEDPQARLHAHKLLGDASTGLSRFSVARRWYQRGIQVAQQLGDLAYLTFQRHNLAVGVELVVGRFAQAQTLLEANAPFYAQAPAMRVTHLVGWACLYVEMGDWANAARVAGEIEALRTAAESIQGSNRFWHAWCRAMTAIGSSDWAAAEATLAEAELTAQGHPDRELALTQARIWLLRRQGEPGRAVHLAVQALDKGTQGAPAGYAALVLEGALAAWQAGDPAYEPLIAEAKRLIAQLRLDTALVRLRALLALDARRAGNPCWRRHAQRALHRAKQPGYQHSTCSSSTTLSLAGRFGRSVSKQAPPSRLLPKR
ncbi:MAG: hypothetical protein NZ693_04440 [Thermoflexales bacterium]|nr:hypothetical protein [Thermoflexales bacterium]